MYFVTDDEFEDLIENSLKQIPKEFAKRLDNVNITFQDLPSRYQLSKVAKENSYPMLLGLYEGIPRTKRGNYGVGGPLPDKITLFKKPIELISQTKGHLREIVVHTLEHEIAHYFGMDESSVRKAQGG